MAPSKDPIPTGPVANPIVKENVKYGEITTSDNGWEVVIDTVDPVEEMTLANGWKVEVKYE